MNYVLIDLYTGESTAMTKDEAMEVVKALQLENVVADADVYKGEECMIVGVKTPEREAVGHFFYNSDDMLEQSRVESGIPLYR